MMDVTTLGAHIPVSAEMLEDQFDIGGEISYLWQESRDRMAGRPHLGPGRREYNQIMAPAWRRQRIRENVWIDGLKPGKYVHVKPRSDLR